MGGFRRTAFWAIGIVAMFAAVEARAQFWGQSEGPPPAGTSRGENFSAKPAAQLFASDCTGAGCHRGPQGLSKDRSQGSLAGFLREHYTNSRESAASLAAFLVSIPAAARPQPERSPRAAARTGDKPDDAAAPRRPPAVVATPPAATTSPAEPAEGGARPETPRQSPAAAAAARAQRGRQTTAAPAVPEPPPPAPAPPPPKEFDIFD